MHHALRFSHIVSRPCARCCARHGARAVHRVAAGFAPSVSLLMTAQDEALVRVRAA